MDAEGLIPHRLYREHCTLVNCEFVKDLSQLGRDLKDVIIVDNSPDCFTLQPCNGIPILTWTNDKSDRELDRLSSILEMLHKVDDVRDYLREVVRDNELDYLEAVRLLKGEISLDDVQRNPSAYWTSPRKKLLTSPERSRSQVKLNETVDKFKDKYNEQKKTNLNPLFALKQTQEAKQKESPKLKHSGDSCTVLPRAIEAVETPTKALNQPLKKPPVTPNNTDIYKPIIKLQPIKSPSTQNTNELYQGLQDANSGKRESSCSKLSSSERALYKSDNRPKLKLPPRPSYKHSENNTPQRIQRLSGESNKYAIKTSYSSSKAVNLSHEYTPTVQVQAYKPPAYPSYGKYIKVSQPSLESYNPQKILRSYGSSTPQHNRSYTGNVAKPYGVYNAFGSRGSVSSYYHK